MTPRENILRVIGFDQPEYVPSIIPGWKLGYNGSNHETIDGSFGDDSPVGQRWSDVWGVGWHKEMAGVMGFPEVFPLADIRKVDSYPFPDPDDPRICDPIFQDMTGLDRDEGLLQGFDRDTLFEQAYMLVGMENLMMAFFDEPQAVKTLLHRITDFHLGIARHYISTGVELVLMGDDLGQQNGPLFSRDILEEFFLPEYRRLLGFYKQHGVLVRFHSCGCIQSLLDLFMDLGIDILTPVQATANDLGLVRRLTQGRMAISGAVPSHIVYEGPPETIRRQVREKIGLLGFSGGYICAPDQGLPFPKSHIEALTQAVSEFGRYPLVETKE